MTIANKEVDYVAPPRARHVASVKFITDDVLKISFHWGDAVSMDVVDVRDDEVDDVRRVQMTCGCTDRESSSGHAAKATRCPRRQDARRFNFEDNQSMKLSIAERLHG